MNEHVDTVKRRSEDNWHLDKRVPIAIIVTFVLTMTAQSVIFAYGYGVLNEKVQHQQAAINKMNDVMPRLVRMETLMEGVLITLKEVRNDLRSSNVRDLKQKGTKK